MDVIHPNIFRFIRFIPKIPGFAVLVLLLLVFVTDLILTVSTILSFNRHLKLLDEASSKIKTVSDEIGENIYEGVIVAMEKSGEVKENIEKKAEQIRLQQEYEKLMNYKTSGMKRLMKAFPHMKSRSYQEVLTRWKNYRNERKL